MLFFMILVAIPLIDFELKARGAIGTSVFSVLRVIAVPVVSAGGIADAIAIAVATAAAFAAVATAAAAAAGAAAITTATAITATTAAAWTAFPADERVGAVEGCPIQNARFHTDRGLQPSGDGWTEIEPALTERAGGMRRRGSEGREQPCENRQTAPKWEYVLHATSSSIY
jgi:hypothetical protein